MKRHFAIAALVAGLVGAPLVADARPAVGVRDFDQGERGGGRQVPLSRVLATIASRTPGRHLNTSMGEAGGRPAYYVQWQTQDGRVIVFVVDAESGAVIGQQGR